MIRRFVVWWVASALAVFAAAYIVPGFHVSGWKPTFVAALVIGLVNGTLGAIIKLLATPIRWLTLGLATLAINALMVLISAEVVDGFRVDSFIDALLGSIVMSVVVMLVRGIASDSD